MYDTVIIGGGPAGLAAAVSAKNEGLENVLVIERDGEAGAPQDSQQLLAQRKREAETF